MGLWTGPFFSLSLSFPFCTLGREWPCLISIVPFKLRNNKAMTIIIIVTMSVCIECLLCVRNGCFSKDFNMINSFHPYTILRRWALSSCLVVLLDRHLACYTSALITHPIPLSLCPSCCLEQTGNCSPWGLYLAVPSAWTVLPAPRILAEPTLSSSSVG